MKPLTYIDDDDVGKKPPTNKKVFNNLPSRFCSVIETKSFLPSFFRSYFEDVTICTFGLKVTQKN